MVAMLKTRKKGFICVTGLTNYSSLTNLSKKSRTICCTSLLSNLLSRSKPVLWYKMGHEDATRQIMTVRQLKSGDVTLYPARTTDTKTLKESAELWVKTLG
jgi:hypothetical protein